MTTTGLPDSTKSCTNATAVASQLVGVDRPARNHQRAEILDGGLRHFTVDGELPRRLQVVIAGIDRARLERQQSYIGARIT
jgi:hypothetical protein